MLCPLFSSGFCPHCGAEVYKGIVQLTGRCPNPECGKKVVVNNDMNDLLPCPRQKTAGAKQAMPGRGE